MAVEEEGLLKCEQATRTAGHPVGYVITNNNRERLRCKRLPAVTLPRDICNGNVHVM